jgi:hypothetical protein
MCNPLNFKKNIKKENNISKTVLYKIPENNKAFFKNNNNEKDDISLLSNANLNIIKILNTFATDDILNDSSYSTSKINEDKDKDKDNIKDKEKTQENIKNNKTNFVSTKDNLKQKKKQKNRKTSGESLFACSNLTDYNPDNNNKKIDGFKLKDNKISGRHLSDINDRSHVRRQKTDDNNHRQRSKSIAFPEDFYTSKFSNISNKFSVHQANTDNNDSNFQGFLSEIEIMKINEDIHNDINFIQLKKKIWQLKKTILNKKTKDSSKFKTVKNRNSSKINSVHKKKNKIR